MDGGCVKQLVKLECYRVRMGVVDSVDVDFQTTFTQVPEIILSM